MTREGNRGGVVAAAAVAAIAVLLFVPLRAGVAGAAPADRIWFAPGPGTTDFVRLFQHPDEWVRARQQFSVFKFYQQHTQTPAPGIVGPNTYTALASAGAFRTLTQWGKKIGIEVGAVKEFYCTADASGMDAAVRDTLASVAAVQTASGTVSYLAMDEPWVSGRSRACGGPALEPTADRVAFYMRGVHAVYPNIAIGLIEAYPFSSADAIDRMLSLLADRGTPPAFLHMDVDWHLSGAPAFVRDIKRLSDAARARGITYGVIITGYNGDADALYAVDAYGMTDLLSQTFGNWGGMPDHLIFQSWAESRTGLLITPNNLPETRAFTHTSLTADILRRLQGATGPSTGHAVIR